MRGIRGPPSSQRPTRTAKSSPSAWTAASISSAAASPRAPPTSPMATTRIRIGTSSTTPPPTAGPQPPLPSLPATAPPAPCMTATGMSQAAAASPVVRPTRTKSTIRRKTAGATPPPCRRGQAQAAMPAARSTASSTSSAASISTMAAACTRKSGNMSPATDAWVAMPPMPTPRHGLGAVVIDSRIWLVGGAKKPSGNDTADTVESFWPFDHQV